MHFPASVDVARERSFYGVASKDMAGMNAPGSVARFVCGREVALDIGEAMAPKVMLFVPPVSARYHG